MPVREFGRAVLAGLIPVAVALMFADVTCGGSLWSMTTVGQHQPLLTEGLGGSRASCRCGAIIPVAAIRCSGRSGLLYLPHYLAHAICRLCGLPNREIAVAHLLHLAAGAAAAYLYLGDRAAGIWPAFVGAVAYGMTGPMLGMATNWNEYCFLMAYVPLMFPEHRENRRGRHRLVLDGASGSDRRPRVCEHGAAGSVQIRPAVRPSITWFASYWRDALGAVCHPLSHGCDAVRLSVASDHSSPRERSSTGARAPATRGAAPDMGLGVMACALDSSAVLSTRSSSSIG